jgi:Holliday junction resolvase RusA-like endonuclease
MIKIPVKPMSMGRAWSQTRAGKRFLVPEAKVYKKLVAQYCKELKVISGHRGALTCVIEYHGQWLTKTGTISKTAGDIDNFSKLILDALCEEYDFDDSQIMELSLKKVISEEWFVLISLIK